MTLKVLRRPTGAVGSEYFQGNAEGWTLFEYQFVGWDAGLTYDWQRQFATREEEIASDSGNYYVEEAAKKGWKGQVFYRDLAALDVGTIKQRELVNAETLLQRAKTLRGSDSEESSRILAIVKEVYQGTPQAVEAAALIAQAATDESTATRAALMEQAKQTANTGDVGGAIALYNRVISEYSESEDASKAVDLIAELKKEQQRGAEEEKRKRLATKLKLGRHFQETGDLERAATLLREALDIEPGSAEARAVLDEVLEAQGDAKRKADDALAAETRAKVANLLQQARTLVGQGRYLEAKAAANEALALDPGHAEAEELLRQAQEAESKVAAEEERKREAAARAQAARDEAAKQAEESPEQPLEEVLAPQGRAGPTQARRALEEMLGCSGVVRLSEIPVEMRRALISVVKQPAGGKRIYTPEGERVGAIRADEVTFGTRTSPVIMVFGADSCKTFVKAPTTAIFTADFIMLVGDAPSEVSRYLIATAVSGSTELMLFMVK